MWSTMTQQKHFKIFKCPIHDYISVPVELVEGFINTRIFQRLHHIVQTSMRPLYPSAHHTRFAHSLGVFHLATKAFDYVVRNTEIKNLKKKLESYKDTFCIAALMHDCGHTPFSHIFEDYYNKINAKSLLIEIVKDADPNSRFENDLKKKSKDKPPKPHEIFSAFIFIKYYQKEWKRLQIPQKISLVARMITGVKHSNTERDLTKQIENCLIELINGPIDMDKLDYILRDTWASGVNNVSIDIQRLLSALMIENIPEKGRLSIVFNKSALSVIQHVIDGRNYLHRWIYRHHTVCYFQNLLQTTINRIFEFLSNDSPSNYFSSIFFSHDVFEKPKSFNGYTIYLPDDSDIRYILKQYRDMPEVDEILSRRPKYIPLWKTHSEYINIFNDSERVSLNRVNGSAKQVIENALNNALSQEIGQSINVRCYEPSNSFVDIEDQNIYIALKKNKIVRFTEAIEGIYGSSRNDIFCYIFIPKKQKKHINKCHEIIKQLTMN